MLVPRSPPNLQRSARHSSPSTAHTCLEIEAILAKSDDSADYKPAMLELLPGANSTSADALRAVAEGGDYTR